MTEPADSRRGAFRRGAFPSVFDAYVTRIQIGLVVVLSFLLVLVYLPGTETMEKTPWGNNRWGDDVTLFDVGGSFAQTRVRPRVQVETAPSQTRVAIETPDTESTIAGDSPDADAPDRPAVRSVATLGPDGVHPKVRGGMQRLYLNLKYPEQAIADRIEGRLILTFVVDEDGRTSDVSVARSLHPLCDSAAVRAVRRTAFYPARADGQPVAVRMSLPIQFRLLRLAGPEDASNDETTELTASEPASEGSHD